jgi:hypothetical protein
VGGVDFVLDYRLTDPEHPCAATSLRDVDEAELRYGCFAGDITFTVASADFSAHWAWVTVLDFALCLRSIGSALDAGATEERFGFTENDDEIIFRRSHGDVQIAATYTADTAVVPLRELVDAVQGFARRAVVELQRDYPDLAANAAAQAMLRPAQGAP